MKRKSMSNIIKTSLVLLSSLILSGCLSGKMSPQQENALGAQQERKVLSQMKTIRSGKYYHKVKRVGQHIAQVSGRSDFHWTYHLIDNAKQANAFVLPGGKIFVYTGLFKYAANDAELAAVLGHEVSHALKSHGVKGASRKQKAGLLGIAIQVGMGVAGIDKQTAKQVTQIYGQGATLGYIRPYSRENETEADSLGLMLMARAGYDPHAALSFWNKFSQKGQRIPEYLSTHPAPESRIENIRNLLPKAMAIYHKNNYKRH